MFIWYRFIGLILRSNLLCLKRINLLILAQLEKEFSLPMNISDEMLKCLKVEVRKKLKEENQNTTALKKDITEKLNQLKDKENRLFDFYLEGKCDETTYNQKRFEIEEERTQLQSDMEKYLEIDENTDEMLVNIAKIAANVGIIFKSPIISKKRDILKLILWALPLRGSSSSRKP